MKLICCPGSGEEVVRSLNSLSNPEPSQIRIEDYAESEVLKPKGYFKLPIVYHADRIENVNLRLMFIYRLVRRIFPTEVQET
jgi:hypothetical protein